MSNSTTTSQSKSKATTAELALHFIENRADSKSSSPSLMAQLAHRQELIAHWDIAPGSRVLEIGCGQGDTTVALADAVGEGGSVVALDPGSPDYGSPATLAQAQAHISSTPIGPRITFQFIDPILYLSTYTGPAYDYVVLSHCIYYFETPADLPKLLTSLLPHTKTLCIAEWSLHASSLTQVPHVLTALLLNTLQTKRDTETHGNIRTILSPPQIASAVLSTTTTSQSTTSDSTPSKFTLLKQATNPSNPGLEDPYWETSFLLRRREKEVAALKARVSSGAVTNAEITDVEAAYDAIQAMVDSLENGVKGVECMDYWIGAFQRT